MEQVEPSFLGMSWYSGGQPFKFPPLLYCCRNMKFRLWFYWFPLPFEFPLPHPSPLFPIDWYLPDLRTINSQAPIELFGYSFLLTHDPFCSSLFRFPYLNGSDICTRWVALSLSSSLVFYSYNGFTWSAASTMSRLQNTWHPTAKIKVSIYYRTRSLYPSSTSKGFCLMCWD